MILFRRVGVVLLLLAGCAAPELGPELPYEEDLEEFQGAFHVHLDPAKPFEDELFDLQEACATAMIDFVVVVDDGLTEAQARQLFESKGGPLFIPAVELENGLLAVGLRRPLPPRADADEIRRRGGLAILRAPKGATWDAAGADGVELYDLEATVARRVPNLAEWRKGIAARLGTEVVAELDDDVLRRWDALTVKGRLLGVAAQATHHGKNARLTYEEAFRLVTTHVDARHRSREAILEAFRKKGGGVFFDALNGYNRAGVMVNRTDEGDSELIVSWSNALGAEHRIFLEGRPVDLETLRMAGFGLSYSHHYRIDRPGSYRVRLDLLVGDRPRPWFLSNPVRAVVR